MNRKVVFAWFLMVVMALSAGACRSINQVTPEGLDEAAIEAEVRAKLAEDVDLKAFSFEVKVDDCAVTLNGHVNTDTERRKAGQAANDVKGVCRVVNNLHVGPR